MRPSSPRSLKGSPQAMIPPPNSFAIPRSASMAAPSIPRTIPRSPGFSSHSYSHSTSPSTNSGGLPEGHNHEAPGMMVSPTQISSASLNAQKRAYRQRRKDPSCDACRERKVKCDATETSACSECSSRNHKCQFTKETNRRMSSIKQVQDLQSQIAELTQLNTQLRTQAVNRDDADSEHLHMKRRESELSIEAPLSFARTAVPTMNNFDQVRENVQRHSHGIFRCPHAPKPSPASNNSDLPELPPRAETARLVRSYQDSIHEWYPVLHWPKFQEGVDQAYTERSFRRLPHEWIGLIFAVLACGTLHGQQASHGNDAILQRGSSYFDIAAQAITPWSHDANVVHVQTCFLLSIFAQESNMGSGGEMWLNAAISAAQGIHLHFDSGAGSAIDVEVQRRLWWALYVRDRFTSLELGRPMMIHEDDCELPLPTPVEDRYIQPQGIFRTNSKTSTITGYMAIIHISRIHSNVKRCLKASSIPSRALVSLDEQIQSVSLQLPEAYRHASNASLEAAALPPLFTMLSAQFHLYRHNLSPSCRPEERMEALSRCLVTAQDTARYVSRTLHNPPENEVDKPWHDRVGPIASNLMCKHLWRCILILCYRSDYDAALMCQHLCATIGRAKKLNIACGKYLLFVLGLLLERAQKGFSSPRQPEHDEEMMAYVSGDAQGNIGHAWVWTIPDMVSPTAGRHSAAPDEPMRDAGVASPEVGSRDADPWIRVEQMIRQLKDGDRSRIVSYHPPPHNPLKRVYAEGSDTQIPRAAPAPSPALSNTSRISIANII